MGIVINQSIKNTLITYLGFGLGAINILFLFTNYLTESYFGLVAYILSTANILMPLMAFGVHNTIIKFYTSYKTRLQQQRFLGFTLILPLIVIIPLGIIGQFAYESIANYLSHENKIIKDYVWLIYISAICFAYFEVFYAWSKVHLHSVFGNFIKEVFHRACIMILLFAHHFDLITVNEFIYSIVIVYAIRLFIMGFYAFSLRYPKFQFNRLTNKKNVFKYSALIIIAGSVALIILELDKVMIGHLIPELGNVAYYGVAIFIATVIDVPLRSMHQINNTLTAQYLNESNKGALEDLYKKSSINLLLVSGFIFLLILINVEALYQILPTNYSEGVLVVFVIGIAKLFNSVLGNNNSILFYSDYYRMILIFGVIIALCTIVMNIIFIPWLGLDGAAIASCITIFMYNTIKLIFVWVKFKISPFTKETYGAIVLIIVLFLGFYFWDITSNPFISISVKSLFCGLIYLFAIYKFTLSLDIINLVNSFVRKLKNPSKNN
jgi:O-antigen/teichoic acid export membrane protein